MAKPLFPLEDFQGVVGLIVGLRAGDYFMVVKFRVLIYILN